MNYDLLLKILVIGNSTVGKSSLLLRYVDDTFKESLSTTIGVDFKWKTEKISEKIVKLQIWDTAGQERFRTITSALYNGAHGALLVYDVTNEESFNSVESWVNEVKKRAAEDISILLVGNKSDLDQQRMVSRETGEGLAKKLGVEFFETSAKTKENVEIAFQHIVDKCLRKHKTIAAKKTDQNNASDSQRVIHAPNPTIRLEESTENSNANVAKASGGCCGK